ncbi:MAG TPA: hypothetical protein VJQ83_02015, partial [Tepidiformaceae bacterium]|nr:hypothetical protein [Tepidiformaceae bacterium]
HGDGNGQPGLSQELPEVRAWRRAVDQHPPPGTTCRLWADGFKGEASRREEGNGSFSIAG